jgi:hypothetical protein
LVRSESMNEQSDVVLSGAKKAVIDVLRSRAKKGRFITEICASLRRMNIDGEDIERALTDLAAKGTVMMRDHFCADPHLAGVDLRVVALVENAESDDAQMSAIRAIDEAWNQWLANYLANHRCG